MASASAASASGWSAAATSYVGSLASVPDTAAIEALTMLMPEVPIDDKPVVLLDIAAGPGTFCLQAVERMKAAGVGGHIVVTDFAKGMVDAAKSKFDELKRQGSLPSSITVECNVMDAQDLSSIEAATITHAACMFGIMFMPDRARCLTELRRVMVPGGRAVIGTWRSAGPATALPAFVRDMQWLAADTEAPTDALMRVGRDAAELEMELRAAGFKEIMVREGGEIRMAFEDGGVELIGVMMENPAIKPLFVNVPPDTDVKAAWLHWTSPGQRGDVLREVNGKLGMTWVPNLALATA